MCTLINYDSLNQKDQNFNTNYYVDDFGELMSIITQLKSKPHLIYRGIHNASYRLYTSAQRHFILKDELYNKIGGIDYHKFIRNAINKVRNDVEICAYFSKNQIPMNDFLVLALLQHYLTCSPLIDFSYQIEPALFFASDMKNWCSVGSPLDEYISLYFTDNRIDWLQATIQAINETGAYNAEEMLIDSAKHGLFADPYDAFYHMKNLTYEQYIKNISFLPVSGCDIGITDINVKSLGLSWKYNITNPRLKAQKGLFIFNVSDTIPIVEQINSITNYYMIFGCVNIKKNLVDEIQSQILMPHGLDSTTMYEQSDDSKLLVERVNKLFQ